MKKYLLFCLLISVFCFLAVGFSPSVVFGQMNNSPISIFYAFLGLGQQQNSPSQGSDLSEKTRRQPAGPVRDQNQPLARPALLPSGAKFHLADCRRHWDSQLGWHYDCLDEKGNKFILTSGQYRQIQEILRRDPSLVPKYDRAQSKIYFTKNNPPPGADKKDPHSLLDSIQTDLNRISRIASAKTPRVGIAPLPDSDKPYQPTDIDAFNTAGFIRKQKEIIDKNIEIIKTRPLSQEELTRRLKIIKDALFLIRTRSRGATTYIFGNNPYINRNDERLLENYEEELVELLAVPKK